MNLDALPPTHRRSIGAVLRVLDDRLEEVEHRLVRGEHGNPARHVVDDVPPEAKAQLLPRVQAMRVRVHGLIQELGLSPESASLYRYCMAALGLGWEMCPDLRPEHMRGYGLVPEEAKPGLRELASELEKDMLTLLSILERKESDPLAPRFRQDPS